MTNLEYQEAYPTVMNATDILHKQCCVMGIGKEDLAQEIMLKILTNKCPVYDPKRGSRKSYYCSIGKRVYVDWIRSKEGKVNLLSTRYGHEITDVIDKVSNRENVTDGVYAFIEKLPSIPVETSLFDYKDWKDFLYDFVTFGGRKMAYLLNADESRISNLKNTMSGLFVTKAMESGCELVSELP